MRRHTRLAASPLSKPFPASNVSIAHGRAYATRRIAGALVFPGSCVIVDGDHSRAGLFNGLNRESWVEIGFGPCGVSRLPARWPVLVSGTAGFSRFRLDAGSDRLPWGPPSWTSSEIEPRDWIWSVWDVGDWRCDDLYRFREPRYFAVSRLVCATSVRCGGGVRGLIRRSDVGLGIGPNTVCRLSAVCDKETRNTAVPG